MIEHVRYEVLQVLEFHRLGNGWCDLLRPDLGAFAARSILEASLMHLRCLIEFLGEEKRAKDRVVALDYLPDWSWSVKTEGVRVRDLHGRIAHLGLVRGSVAAVGDFSWSGWLADQAPNVLGAFREFLTQLRTADSRRYDLFEQPRHELAKIDLLPVLDAALGDPRR